VGGRYFHAPFIEAAGHEIVGVVTRAPQRRAQLAHDLPAARAVDSLDDLLALGVDAVTITTPPHTHQGLVIQALRAGVPVIADKPFAPDADEARELIRVAEETGTPLSVYHNRRWDGDFLTVQQLVRDHAVGDVSRLHFAFDLDDPAGWQRGPGGGVLRDLGAHVVDQALALFGPVSRVTAWLDTVPVDDRLIDRGFALTLEHSSGVVSQLSATKLGHLNRRGWELYGSVGSFVLNSHDVQGEALLAGRRPVASPEDWGLDTADSWGSLHTADGTRMIATRRGDYTQFYRQFADAVATGGALPVTARSALAVVEVLDAAERSASIHQTIQIGA
jgi:predicted dehydrogenase